MTKELEAAAQFKQSELQEGQLQALQDTIDQIKTKVAQIISSQQEMLASAAGAADVRASITNLL